MWDLLRAPVGRGTPASIRAEPARWRTLVRPKPVEVPSRGAHDGGVTSRLRVVAAVAVFAALGMAVQLWTHRSDARVTVDMRSVASVLAAHHRPGDAIVYGSADPMRAAVEDHVPQAARPRDVLAAPECAAPAPCLAGLERVWVLLPEVAPRPLEGLSVPAQIALAHYLPTGQWPVAGGTLALFTASRP